MSRTVKMWGFKQKSKYGVRSAIFCADRKKLERERKRCIKDGFTVEEIKLTDKVTDSDFRELWVEVY